MAAAPATEVPPNFMTITIGSCRCRRRARRVIAAAAKDPGGQRTPGNPHVTAPSAISAAPNLRMPNTHTGRLTVTRQIALLAGLGALVSCSSLIERSAPPPSKIFPGVRLDFEIATVSGGHWDGPGTLPFRCVWATLDLPFSLAFDTVMLPWDAAMAWADSHPGRPAPERAEIVEREKVAAPGAGGVD